MRLRGLLVVALGAVTSTGLLCPLAQAELVRLPRIQGPIAIDGVGDDSGWAPIPPVPLVVYEPVFGQPPSQRTEIRLGYDDHHLYLYARSFDQDPEGIRVGSLQRDRYAGDDTVGLIVDGFNDNRNALWFYTTPAGNRTDGTIVDDLASGQPDWSWNGHWDAAAQRTEDGWTAEMRIPFSTLGFQMAEDLSTLGISVYRWIARYQERQIWPPNPPRWERAYAKPSQLQDVAVERVATKRPLYMSPYLLTGRQERTGTGLDGGEPGNTWLREMGVDGRYMPNARFTVDLTVNTDFAQAEVDDVRINLGRFPLFYPEKRPFFLERAGVFQWELSGQSQLFYSRRIGLEDGEPVRLWGGARVVGRQGPYELGVLSVQAAPHRAQPSENLSVVRLRRQLGIGRSQVGGIVTSRIAASHHAQVTCGLDADLHVSGDDFLTLKGAQAFSQGWPPPLADGEDAEPSGPQRTKPWDTGHFASVAWQRRRIEGLSYRLEISRMGDRFEPGLGFMERSQVSSGRQDLMHQWLRGEGSPFRAITVGHSTEVHIQNSDRSLQSLGAEPFGSLQFKSGDELRASLLLREEGVRQTFSLPRQVEVPAGHYRFIEGRLALGLSSGRKLNGESFVGAGRFYDGHRLTVGLSPAWYASRYLRVRASYEGNRIVFPSRGQALDTHLAQLELNLAYDIHSSLAALIQHSTVEGVSANLRGRYHVREGHDVWLVYRTLNRRDLKPQNPDLEGEFSFTSVPREHLMMVKYVYTLLL